MVPEPVLVLLGQKLAASKKSWISLVALKEEAITIY